MYAVVLLLALAASASAFRQVSQSNSAFGLVRVWSFLRTLTFTDTSSPSKIGLGNGVSYVPPQFILSNSQNLQTDNDANDKDIYAPTGVTVRRTDTDAVVKSVGPNQQDIAYTTVNLGASGNLGSSVNLNITVQHSGAVQSCSPSTLTLSNGLLTTIIVVQSDHNADPFTLRFVCQTVNQTCSALDLSSVGATPSDTQVSVSCAQFSINLDSEVQSCTTDLWESFRYDGFGSCVFLEREVSSAVGERNIISDTLPRVSNFSSDDPSSLSDWQNSRATFQLRNDVAYRLFALGSTTVLSNQLNNVANAGSRVSTFLWRSGSRKNPSSQATIETGTFNTGNVKVLHTAFITRQDPNNVDNRLFVNSLFFAIRDGAGTLFVFDTVDRLQQRPSGSADFYELPVGSYQISFYLQENTNNNQTAIVQNGSGIVAASSKTFTVTKNGYIGLIVRGTDGGDSNTSFNVLTYNFDTRAFTANREQVIIDNFIQSSLDFKVADVNATQCRFLNGNNNLGRVTSDIAENAQTQGWRFPKDVFQTFSSFQITSTSATCADFSSTRLAPTIAGVSSLSNPNAGQCKRSYVLVTGRQRTIQAATIPGTCIVGGVGGSCTAAKTVLANIDQLTPTSDASQLSSLSVFVPLCNCNAPADAECRDIDECESAEFDGISNQVAAVASSIAKLSSDVSVIRTSVAGVSSQVNSIDDDVQAIDKALDNGISDIEGDIDDLGDDVSRVRKDVKKLTK